MVNSLSLHIYPSYLNRLTTHLIRLSISTRSPIAISANSIKLNPTNFLTMASVASSSFHCFSSSSSRSIASRSSSSSPPVNRVRFQKSRPISAVCAAAPVTERSAASFYDVLGIQSGASCQEIKAAYRRLARVLHPDVVAATGQNDTSADDFIRVHEAYSTLSDPGKRADYDRALFIRRRLMEGSSSFVNAMSSGRVRGPSASRFTPRSWETDQCW